MRKTILLFTILIPCLCGYARAEVTLRAKWSPIANFAYQADCLSSDAINCSRENYAALWNRKFLANPADRQAFNTWLELRRRYTSSADVYKSKNTGRNLINKWRIAGMQAATLSAYKKKLAQPLEPADKAVMNDFVDRFYPKFMNWWKAEADPAGANYVETVNSLLDNAELRKKLAQFVAFYEVQLPDETELPVMLIYRAADVGQPMLRGEYLGNYAIAEFNRQDDPKRTLATVVHETCHYFYAHPGRENAGLLRQKFAGSENPVSTPARNLLNEALATALGTAMTNRSLMDARSFKAFFARPRSFYEDEYIDRATKAVFAFMDQWLARGRTLFHEDFADGYISVIAREFGERLPPQLYFHKMFLVEEDFGASLVDPIIAAIHPSDLRAAQIDWSVNKLPAELKTERDLSYMLVMHPDSLQQLKTHQLVPAETLREISYRLKQEPDAVYVYQRAPSVFTVVIIARDYETAVKGIGRFTAPKIMSAGMID
ncbi:MAG: hypothetical protein PHW69_08930 [Elusimicrobiaceae bacterium]|nr:hypothetical protein [Elusimicrobiaceae bacterium]